MQNQDILLTKDYDNKRDNGSFDPRRADHHSPKPEPKNEFKPEFECKPEPECDCAHECEECGKNKKDDCFMLRGNSVDVSLDRYDCEVRSDIVVSKERSIRLWGQIVDCEGRGVKNALIKLLQVEKKHDHKFQYHGIAHTVSDCEGFYQFDIPDCECDNDNHYKILVSKAATGKEKVLYARGNCDPCKENPCKSIC